MGSVMSGIAPAMVLERDDDRLKLSYDPISYDPRATECNISSGVPSGNFFPATGFLLISQTENRIERLVLAQHSPPLPFPVHDPFRGQVVPETTRQTDELGRPLTIPVNQF